MPRISKRSLCVSDGLLWIKAFSADNKWFKRASRYSGLQRQKYVATMRANRIIQLITSGSYRWCLCVCASHTWCSRRSRCCRCSPWWSSRRWRPGTLCHTVPAWSDPSSELRGGRREKAARMSETFSQRWNFEPPVSKSNNSYATSYANTAKHTASM